MSPSDLTPIIDQTLDSFDEKDRLDLALGDCRIRVRVDGAELGERLRDYLRYFLTEGSPDADIEVVAVESAPIDYGWSFNDWKRDPGKVGPKDAFVDLQGGRVIQKVRTGMHFFLSDDHRIAIGPCLKNDNQVINFINAQFISWLLDREYCLCHAAAVLIGDRGMAFAGMSGAGKSTLALHLLARGHDYVSNDRLLVRGGKHPATMCGVPKLPRVNPGTILSLPPLHSILDEQRRQDLQNCPPDELWNLEEKYDVDVARQFDGCQFRIQGPLHGFVVLNWNRQSDQPTQVERIDIRSRDDLLSAIMKPAGPFCQRHRKGEAAHDHLFVDKVHYLRELESVPVYEVRGRIDFEMASHFVEKTLETS